MTKGVSGRRSVRESKGVKQSEGVSDSKGVGVLSVRERGVSASYLYRPIIIHQAPSRATGHISKPSIPSFSVPVGLQKEK